MKKLQERLEITLRRSDGRQVLPDGEPRKSVVRFGLHEEALRVRNIDQRRQPCLVTHAFLVLGGTRGVEFQGSVLGNMAAPFEGSLPLPELAGHVLPALLVTGRFGAFLLGSNLFSRTQPDSS